MYTVLIKIRTWYKLYFGDWEVEAGDWDFSSLIILCSICELNNKVIKHNKVWKMNKN